MKRSRVSRLSVCLAVALALGGAALSGAAGAASSGGTVKVGVLHSLSGTMAISEVAVRDSTLLAIKEINDAGGVLGKQIKPVVEDGASDWPTFAEKAEKLITVDNVKVTFGGWTSASRKAMLPVFEGFKGLLFYPGPVRGPRAVAQHLLHRCHHEPADHSCP